MHEEMEGMETKRILEDLPPVAYAPILRPLGQLGLERFRAEYGIDTPLLPNGIVDHEALVVAARELVSPDYRWSAPFFDEHHLHWKARYYNPGLHDGNMLPSQFRDLAIHKIWIARGFHQFLHVVTKPSDVPALEVMEESVENFRQNNHIFTLSSEAIRLRERDERSVPLRGQDDRVIDPVTKRVIDVGRYEERLQDFIQQIKERFEAGVPPDLTHLSSLSLEEPEQIAAMLPQIRRDAKRAIAYSNNRRRGRAVLLRIDHQTREPTHTAA